MNEKIKSKSNVSYLLADFVNGLVAMNKLTAEFFVYLESGADKIEMRMQRSPWC